jgi:hypothetical protein
MLLHTGIPADHLNFASQSSPPLPILLFSWQFQFICEISGGGGKFGEKGQ